MPRNRKGLLTIHTADTEHHQRTKGVLKVQTVPGGSDWQCIVCRRTQLAGAPVVKRGRQIYCTKCVQEDRG